MSVSFSQFRGPQDEEQALTRHMEYLRTKARSSKSLQDAALNVQLNIQPLMQVPKTSAEILADEAEVNKRVQNILTQIFVDNPSLPYNPTVDNEATIFQKRFPSKYVFDQMDSPMKVTLLEHLPAIKADLTQFGLLTPAAFLTYMRNYRVAIARSGGVREFGTMRGLDELTALIKNIPAPTDLRSLEDTIQRLRVDINSNDLIRGAELRDVKQKIARAQQGLDVLIRTMPTMGELGVLQQALTEKIQENSSVPEAQQILSMFRDLPSAEMVREVLRDIHIMDENQLTHANAMAKLNRLEEVLGNITEEQAFTTRQTIRGLEEEVRRANAAVERQGALIDIRLKAGMKDKFYKQAVETKLAALNNEIDAENALTTRLGLSRPIKKHLTDLPVDMKRQLGDLADQMASMESISSSEGILVGPNRADEIPAIYDSSAYASAPSGSSSQGQGLGSPRARRHSSKIHPKYTIMGKGISIKDEPRYIEFGKFAIDIMKLNQNQLKVKHSGTLGAVTNFNCCDVSDDFLSFLETFIDTQKINSRMLEKLSSEEQHLFKKLITRSGLSIKYKMRDLLSNEEKKDEERFHLVKSEFMAGNDSEDVKKELRRYIVKYMTHGRIGRREGGDLLIQLSM